MPEAEILQLLYGHVF